MKIFIFSTILLFATVILSGCKEKEKKRQPEQYKADAQYTDTVTEQKVDKNEVRITHPIDKMDLPSVAGKSPQRIHRPARGYMTYEIKIEISSGDESTAIKKTFVQKLPIYAPHHRSTRSHAPKFKPKFNDPAFAFL